MRPSSDDEPRIHAVRLTEPAEAEMDNAYFAMISRISLDFASRWREGILKAIQKLELFPESHQVAEPESRILAAR